MRREVERRRTSIKNCNGGTTHYRSAPRYITARTHRPGSGPAGVVAATVHDDAAGGVTARLPTRARRDGQATGTARDRAPRAVNAATAVFHRAGRNRRIVGHGGPRSMSCRSDVWSSLASHFSACVSTAVCCTLSVYTLTPRSILIANAIVVYHCK